MNSESQPLSSPDSNSLEEQLEKQSQLPRTIEIEDCQIAPPDSNSPSDSNPSPDFIHPPWP